jgi:cellulose synthase/poly-beta-1,6-N-acetylglucosamine synthase-like glycosyltransferase
MFTVLYIILASICLVFLLLPFLTTLSSLLTRERKPAATSQELDFANVITAYRNVKIARPLVESLLRQNHYKHHIYLIADNCNAEEWDFEHEQLTVLFPNPSLNLKVKSIIHATEHFVRTHDYVAVYDADNLAHPDFLTTLNQYAVAGHRSIQGQRTAKNLNTTMAAVDALGEFYKNYVERYATYLLGSSAVISGSGMAVKRELYQAYLDSEEIQAGKEKWKKMLQEDKILQNFLLGRNERIAYAWDAIIYDEKVDNAEGIETQRSRWLYSYFQNLPNSSSLLLKGLFQLSWNQFFFGLVTLSLPLFILIAFAGVLFLIGWFFSPAMSVAILVAGLLFVWTIFWTLFLSKVPQQVWDSLSGVPLFVWKQVTALFKMRNPNKNFKHTTHTQQVDIDEVLRRKN